jgi:hypothetical protein
MTRLESHSGTSAKIDPANLPPEIRASIEAQAPESIRDRFGDSPSKGKTNDAPLVEDRTEVQP